MHITSSLILIYNAAGERTWKLTGEDQEMLINGKTTVNAINFSKTLYDGSYMVMTDQEYTKHYFIEGERVCSKLGTGFEYALYSPLDKPIAAIEGSVDDIPGNLWTMVHRGIKCVDYPGEVYNDAELRPAENDGNEFETDLYFYHPDHLGSSSFITDATGRVNQHLQYLPFGETYVDQRADKYENIRYKFSGKEKDDETGYDYFGARYYNSELSVWLSVDPMAGKYPSLSPYAYCANNPVNLVDPDGNKIKPTDEQSKNSYDASIDNKFGEGSKVSNLIKSSYNTYTGSYENIDSKSFRKAIKGLNATDKAIARTIRRTINSENIVGFMAISNHSDINIPSKGIFSNSKFNADSENNSWSSGDVQFYENEKTVDNSGKLNVYKGLILAYANEEKELPKLGSIPPTTYFQPIITTEVARGICANVMRAFFSVEGEQYDVSLHGPFLHNYINTGKVASDNQIPEIFKKNKIYD